MAALEAGGAEGGSGGGGGECSRDGLRRFGGGKGDMGIMRVARGNLCGVDVERTIDLFTGGGMKRGMRLAIGFNDGF